jgi:hypothetical protein
MLDHGFAAHPCKLVDLLNVPPLRIRRLPGATPLTAGVFAKCTAGRKTTGYKVKRSYVEMTPNEIKEREEAALKVIADKLRSPS